MVSFRWDRRRRLPACTAREPFTAGSRPGWASLAGSHLTGELHGPAVAYAAAAAAGGVGSGGSAAIREQIRQALLSHFGANASAWLPDVSVQIERPAQRQGPNVWLLFPTYHGARQAFNGFCEDRPEGCECTGEVGACSHPFCRGKHTCRVLPRGSEAHVDNARAFAAALKAEGALLGRRVHRVRASVFYVRRDGGSNPTDPLRRCAFDLLQLTHSGPVSVWDGTGRLLAWQGQVPGAAALPRARRPAAAVPRHSDAVRRAVGGSLGAGEGVDPKGACRGEPHVPLRWGELRRV